MSLAWPLGHGSAIRRTDRLLRRYSVLPCFGGLLLRRPICPILPPGVDSAAQLTGSFLRYAFAASDLWYTSSGEWLGSDVAFSGLLGALKVRGMGLCVEHAEPWNCLVVHTCVGLSMDYGVGVPRYQHTMTVLR